MVKIWYLGLHLYSCPKPHKFAYPDLILLPPSDHLFRVKTKSDARGKKVFVDMAQAADATGKKF